MSITINLKPEDVEAMVRDSIMKSGFGQAVTKSLQSVLTGYNNPIEAELRAYVSQVVKELLASAYGDEIKAAVSETMRSKVTKEILQKFTDTAIDKIVAAAEDRRY